MNPAIYKKGKCISKWCLLQECKVDLTFQYVCQWKLQYWQNKGEKLHDYKCKKRIVAISNTNSCLKSLRNRKWFPLLKEHIYSKPIVGIIANGEILHIFLLKIENKARMFTFTTPIWHYIGYSSCATRQGKEINDIKLVNEEISLS